MNNLNQEWLDPKTHIWGFHCHQELPLSQLGDALVIQKCTATFLKQHGVKIDAADAFKPGYGPHLQHMWELRIESAGTDAVNQLGLAASYMAINRSGLNGYIHPLRHDPNLPEDLETEGRLNQTGTLWLTEKVPQNQDFFFNPPRDKNNQIIDTRSARVMSKREKNKLISKARNLEFRDPAKAIDGYHIHVDFEEKDREFALQAFEQFKKYLSANKIGPFHSDTYQAGTNGPHVLPGWEVKFRNNGAQMFHNIGTAIGWLMCNRQNLPVYIHPVTWSKGGVDEIVKAHADYALFLGDLPPLNLAFFTDR